MDIDEYQFEAAKTSIYPVIGERFVYPLIGLIGETGELAEKIKKLFRDSGGVLTPEIRESIKKELGDILWYLANISNEFGFTLEQVAQCNLDKISSRKEKGTLQGSGDDR